MDLVGRHRSDARFNKVYGPSCTLADTGANNTSFTVGAGHYEWRPTLKAARKDTEQTLSTQAESGYDDYDVFAAREFGKGAFGYYESIGDTAECWYYFRHRNGRLFEATVAFWKQPMGQRRTCDLAHRWTEMLF